MTDHDQDELDPIDIPTDTLAETDNFAIWRSQEPDGEATYHVDIDIVTLHFYQEEWDEFVSLIQKAGGGAKSEKVSAPPAGKKHKK